MEYGEFVSAVPTFAPSTKNCTPTTPTLSEAVAVNVVVPLIVAPLPGDVIETVGAVVSLVFPDGPDVLPPPQPNSSTAATRNRGFPQKLKLFTGINRSNSRGTYLGTTATNSD
jgi:hypothetical protein